MMSELTSPDRTAQGVAQYVAGSLQALLRNKLTSAAGSAFYVWLRPDRIIIGLDPLAVKNIDQVLNSRFVHHLSTVLGGRKVVPTNSRGIYFQIGYYPRPSSALHSKSLDLTAQPSPLHVPIGETRNGPLWLNITEIDSALIGGSRGMGKSFLIHAWVQALLHGDQARLFLWDGKDNIEFGRYEPMGAFVHKDLSRVLLEISTETERRKAEMTAGGYSSVAEYNERNPLPIPPMVLIIDEAAFVPPDCQEAIRDLVARGRAWGVYPILATQRPSVAEVQALVKANLSTRISFAVPANHDSMVILERGGAEKLPKEPGRLLLVWRARAIKAQAYSITKPVVESMQPAGADLALMRRAQAETEGRLSISVLKGWDIKEWDARQLLDDWQGRGWLVVGEKNARYLSPGILQLLSQAPQAPQTASSRPQAAQTDRQPISTRSQTEARTL